MTDRVRTLIVLLEEDTRADDAADVAELLKRIRYVADVRLGPVVGLDAWVVRNKIRRELGQQIWDLIAGKKS